MLPTALEIGISVNEYWDLTYGEILLYIDTYNQKQITEMKHQALMDYKLAELIGCAFGGKFPTLYETYPSLFEEEAKQEKIEIQKQRLMEFALNHNKGGVNK